MYVNDPGALDADMLHILHDIAVCGWWPWIGSRVHFCIDIDSLCFCVVFQVPYACRLRLCHVALFFLLPMSNLQLPVY